MVIVYLGSSSYFFIVKTYIREGSDGMKKGRGDTSLKISMVRNRGRLNRGTRTTPILELLLERFLEPALPKKNA
jgi:hypothetical protein